MNEAFIPEEAETTTKPATAATGEQKYVPVEDGYYWCHPAIVRDTKSDGTPIDDVNIAIRVGFKPFQTAPLGGEGVPVDENAELASDTIVIVYGATGRIWDMKKGAWRAATDADTEEAVAKLARIFPEWVAYEADDPAEKIAWFITHLEEFQKCKCLCKISHSVGRTDGKTYANARLVERKEHTADTEAIAAKLTRGHKAIFGKVFGKLNAAAKPVAKPAAEVKGNAPIAAPSDPPIMPPEAPVDERLPESTKAECWQYYCENHPDKGKTTGAWLNAIAEVKAARDKASELQFTAADWGALMKKLCDMWPNF